MFVGMTRWLALPACILALGGCSVSWSYERDQFDLDGEDGQLVVYDATVRGQLVGFEPVWKNIMTLETKAGSEAALASVPEHEQNKYVLNEEAGTITLNGSVVWLRERRLRTFSEAKPDAALETSLGASLATAFSGTFSGAPVEGKLDGAFQFAEKIVNLAARTERVEVLRDALMRLSEANFNGSITQDQFVSSFDQTLAAVVKLSAVEVILELEKLRQDLGTAAKTLDKLLAELAALRKQLEATGANVGQPDPGKPLTEDQKRLLKELEELSKRVDTASKEKSRIEGLIEENNKLKDQILRAIGSSNTGLISLVDRKVAAETARTKLVVAQTAFKEWKVVDSAAGSTADAKAKAQLAAKSAAESASLTVPPNFEELESLIESGISARVVEIRVLDELIRDSIRR